MKQYKAILFDLWNTLAYIVNLDSLISDTKEELGDDRYNKLMKLFIEWHTHNKSEHEFIEDVNKEIVLSQDEIQQVKLFLAPRHFEKFPETVEVLDELKEQGLNIVLVTNSPPSAKKLFRKMNIEQFFDKILFSCDLGILKPNEDIFLEALHGLKIKPEEALMVGDSLENDVQGAIDSGLNGLLLDRKGLSDYKDKIGNLREVLDKIEK